MSAAERDRSHLIWRTVEKSLSQREAAERLDLSVRQFKRLVRAWKRHGDAGLLSRQRGRVARNGLPETGRLRIEHLLRETYPDFGATLAAEKLSERDGIVVSRETVGASNRAEAAPGQEARREASTSVPGTAAPGLANWSRSTAARID